MEQHTSETQPQPELLPPTPAAKPPFLTVPIAIIIAGGLIAGSVFGTNLISAKSGVANVEGAAKPGISPLELAVKAGVNKKDFTQCFNEGRFRDRVDSDIAGAIASGGTGTPHTILVSKDGQKVVVEGAQPHAAVKAIIDGLLAQKKNATADNKIKIEPLRPDDHILGNPSAQVIIYEYSDLQCPFCQQFHKTMNQIVREYTPDQVAWVYRHFPLESIHPDARPKAEASECVASLGGEPAFWTFINLIFN